MLSGTGSLFSPQQKILSQHLTTASHHIGCQRTLKMQNTQNPTLLSSQVQNASQYQNNNNNETQSYVDFKQWNKTNLPNKQQSNHNPSLQTSQLLNQQMTQRNSTSQQLNQTIQKFQKEQQVIFQSFMRKEGGSVKSWKRRFFELTRTHLHYYRSTTGNTRAEHLNSIEISSLLSVKPHSGLYRGYDFVIVLETEKRVYWFSCESAYEQAQWLHYIHLVKEGKYLEEQQTKTVERIDLKLSQQMEVARCAIEIHRRALAGIQSPHEEAYFEALKYFYRDLKKWRSTQIASCESQQPIRDQSSRKQENQGNIGNQGPITSHKANETDSPMDTAIFQQDSGSFRKESICEHGVVGTSQGFSWDYATATCLLAIPEDELDDEEREWVKLLNLEYDRYQSRIKNYNEKTRCKLDSDEQDIVVNRVLDIFNKPAHERSTEENNYLRELKDTYWKLYRMEKENGLKINHTRLSGTLSLFSKCG